MMIQDLAAKIFGTKNDRDIRGMQPALDRINALEPSFRVLSDQALREKTDEFKARLAKQPDYVKRRGMLEELLPEELPHPVFFPLLQPGGRASRS